MVEITPELLKRLDDAEGRLVERNAAAAPAGGLQVQRFGAVVAFSKRSSGSSLRNRAVGLDAAAIPALSAICAWFDAADVPPRLDICPARNSPDLVAALTQAGLSQCGIPEWSRRLWTGTPRAGGLSEDVQPIQDGQVEAFIGLKDEIWSGDPAGFGRRVETQRQLMAAGALIFGVWRDGQLAAICGLDIVDGVGMLTLAAVRQSFRSQGLQRLMLDHRSAVAQARGAELLWSLTSPDSASGENMRRAGLVAAADRETWLREGWWEHPMYAES